MMESFHHLVISPEGRAHLIQELFEKCSHTEQLDVLSRLTLCLKRDFLVALPLELTERILSYLDSTFVLGTCMLVSKLWYQTIKSCDSYWRTVCTSSGFPREIVKREKARLGCYSSTAMGFLKREESVKRKFHARQNYTTLCNYQDIVVLVEPLANGFYIRHSKTPSPSLSLLKVDNGEDYICAKKDDIFPNGILQILWCKSTPNQILLHANNATWIEFAFESNKPYLHATFSEWDDMIVPRIFNEYSSCASCCLVMTISKSLRDFKCLECVFIELRKIPVKKIYRYEVVKEFLFESCKSYHLFKVNKIHLYCNEQCSGRDYGEPLCKEHFVLLQVRHRIVRYQVRRLEASGKCTYELSDPINTMCATYPGSAPVRIHSLFTLSRDKKLVGYLTSYDYCDVTFHTWNLESGMYQKRELELDSYCIQDLNFLAVGSLYSVLEILINDKTKLKKEVVALQTDSGKIVVRDCMSSVVFCGCNEEWMSSLSTLEEPRLFKFMLLNQSGSIHQNLEDL